MSLPHPTPTQPQTGAQHTPELLGLVPSMQSLTPSATLAINETIAARRAAGHEVIHLGFGEASFPLHPLLRSALVEAATRTGYAPVMGIPALRQAIAGYLSRARGLNVPAAHIV